MYYRSRFRICSFYGNKLKKERVPEKNPEDIWVYAYRDITFYRNKPHGKYIIPRWKHLNLKFNTVKEVCTFIESQI